MANVDSRKDNIKPFVEALDKYNNFNPENETLDDDDSGYSVYFQKNDDVPIQLAKPSLALFHGDLTLYNQESSRIRLDRFAMVLNAEMFPRNSQNFNELLKVQRANKITPFIGAGASISAGCTSWYRYLENKGREVGLGEAEIKLHLDENRLEDLLDLIENQPRGAAFEFYFEQDFEHANPEDSYVWDFPDLFNGCVITTNFDRVIESCYDKQGKSFKEKTVGLNNPSSFIKAITRGDRYLLKLHGNIDDPNYRVFKKGEYQQAYSGNDQQLVDMTYPLPKLLSNLYSSHSFLFIGCSLDVDRTVKTFELILESGESTKIADHYAIIEKPGSDEKYYDLERQLMMCNIKPIWFDTGSYERVGEIVELMSY